MREGRAGRGEKLLGLGARHSELDNCVEGGLREGERCRKEGPHTGLGRERGTQSWIPAAYKDGSAGLLMGWTAFLGFGKNLFRASRWSQTAVNRLIL